MTSPKVFETSKPDKNVLANLKSLEISANMDGALKRNHSAASANSGASKG